MAFTHPAAHPTVAAEPVGTPRPPRRRTGTRLMAAATALAVAAGLGYLARRYPAEARGVWESVAGKARPKQALPLAERPTLIGRVWDGLITLPAHKQEVLGLSTVKAAAQSEPIRLELLGTTEYISDTL